LNDVLLEIAPLKLTYPNLVKLLQFAFKIVVSTAECEQSFSALKRIKSYLRSTMSEEHLSSLAIFSIERQLADSLSLDEVIDKFATRDKNRRIVLS